MVKIQSLVIFGCTIALALFLICLAGSVWIKLPGNYQSFSKANMILKHYGLWEVCFQDGKCKSIDAKFPLGIGPKWLQGVRGLTIAAAGTQLVGIVIAIGNIYRPFQFKIINAVTTLFVGPFCMMIALAVFTAVEGPTPKGQLEWGWSYIIGWFGTCIVPAYGLAIACTMDDKYYQSTPNLNQEEEEEL